MTIEHFGERRADVVKIAALAYIRRSDGGILSVWNRKYLCWGLPGGKADEGESIDEALRRELKEETGLDTQKIWYPELDCSPTYSGSGRMCYTFEVKPWSLVPHVSELGTGIGWQTREFLEKDARTGEWFRKFFAKLPDERRFK